MASTVKNRIMQQNSVVKQFSRKINKATGEDEKQFDFAF